MNKFGLSMVIFTMLLTIPLLANKDDYQVLDIEDENTKQVNVEKQDDIKANEFVSDLLADVDTEIHNPFLIKQLNETAINPSPFAIGYRGKIFLGRWPLSYQSSKASWNWKYQKVNEIDHTNMGDHAPQSILYQQEEEKHVYGALADKVDHADQIKQMIWQQAQEKEDLPLTFHAVVGQHTQIRDAYQLSENQSGSLTAFVPAKKETGETTYADVYIQLKGANKELIVKDVTTQSVSAWLPVANHITLTYESDSGDD
ncbi:hypothetical protein J416_02559 [Gracilibacillus halophilus YIM-C55.5]|uniref:YfkD-like protein n=1 Tax=Gracilibacillus halophilus YIM-C55.5 TaxID=1308866 RepID=N4WCK0_9BACI|nr:YfkD family protein [Gracilibacillus halophilus]ENH97998.1 hypothetical protein J416_02559 [Gracilibacillus halophilus YIM-C55.5]